MSREQLPKSVRLVAQLAKIPDEFIDDGCSNSPDSIFGFDLSWACRKHDWSYCTRCHFAGTMTQHDRLIADTEIRIDISAALPWRWRWVKYVYYRVLRLAGGTEAWNSCGPTSENEEGYCRHNMPRPDWMTTSSSDELGREPL